MDFHVILTLHSLFCLLCNLGQDFQNESQGFRSALWNHSTRTLNSSFVPLWTELDGVRRCFCVPYTGEVGLPVDPRAKESVGAELWRAVQALCVTGGREEQDLVEGAAPTGHCSVGHPYAEPGPVTLMFWCQYSLSVLHTCSSALLNYGCKFWSDKNSIWGCNGSSALRMVQSRAGVGRRGDFCCWSPQHLCSCNGLEPTRVVGRMEEQMYVCL